MFLIRSKSTFAIVSMAIALLLIPRSRAVAEALPNPQQIARPAETQALAEIVAVMGERRTASTALQRLDVALSHLHEPTPLRGLAQFLRGSALLAQERTVEAREALEESIRLLPGYSGPLLAAAGMEVYADRPAQATDYLLRASEIDPDVVRQIPDYELNNILSRLEIREDRRRRRQLADRLFAIGWLGDSLILRSSLAKELIEARLDTGDLEGARTFLPRLVNPEDARSLLMQNRYRILWPDLERWSGPRQERLWQPFLGELRAKWRASRDREHALAYVRGLAAAAHYRTIATEMLPLFSANLDRRRDYDLLWVASPLASALARLGRWDDIESIYNHALRTWPLGSDANALNIIANRGRYRLYQGNPASAIRDLDAAIADAANYPGEVSARPLAGMHFYRACALHQLGRDAEAISSVAIVLRQMDEPAFASDLHLCFDRHDAARSVLIAALNHEDLRDDVIDYVQLDDNLPMQSEFHRMMLARKRALQADPVLLAELTKYGRVLPHTLSAGAPAEGDEP